MACDLDPFQYSSTHDIKKPPTQVQLVQPALAFLQSCLSDEALNISRVRLNANAACASSISCEPGYRPPR